MSTYQLQMRRGSTSQIASFTGAAGELTVDSDKNTLVVHDGTTVGGHYIASAADVATIINIHRFLNTNQASVDTFDATVYRSARYNVQITCGTSYQSVNINVLHDGTTVHKVIYNDLNTSGSLGTFDAHIVSGTFELLFTPNTANTFVRYLREILPVA
jgi:acyl-coenzyme A thioesterase PaaI-like protein